jgi:hypothetical protein
MTSVVIDHLESCRDPQTGVAYVYCNFRRQDEQTPCELLASLLRKLSRDKWHSVRDIVKRLYDKHKHSGSRPSLDELSEALRSVSATYLRVFIVIDAVDESRHSDGRMVTFLTAIFKLQESCGGNIFATSRSLPDITCMFKETITREIKAPPDDVDRYIQYHMSRLPDFVQGNLRLQEEIKTQIIESVQGM